MSKLPGKTLRVGVTLWYLVGLSKSRNVCLSNVMLSRFGMDRNAKYRALHHMEVAGLITVNRVNGKSLRVTVLEVENKL